MRSRVPARQLFCSCGRMIPARLTEPLQAYCTKTKLGLGDAGSLDQVASITPVPANDPVAHSAEPEKDAKFKAADEGAKSETKPAESASKDATGHRPVVDAEVASPKPAADPIAPTAGAPAARLPKPGMRPASVAGPGAAPAPPTAQPLAPTTAPIPAQAADAAPIPDAPSSPGADPGKQAEKKNGKGSGDPQIDRVYVIRRLSRRQARELNTSIAGDNPVGEAEVAPAAERKQDGTRLCRQYSQPRRAEQLGPGPSRAKGREIGGSRRGQWQSSYATRPGCRCPGKESAAKEGRGAIARRPGPDDTARSSDCAKRGQAPARLYLRK